MAERNPPLRMLAYARVSTGRQGLSLSAQRRALAVECDRQGWTLLDVLTDNARSGATLDRPQLQHALAEIAAGRADGLMAMKLDRISRSLVDAVSLMRWFDRAGAVLVIADLGLNTGTASGRLVASVIAALGEWERDSIRERTSTALAEKRAQGRPISRPAVVDQRPDLAARIDGQRRVGTTWQSIADGLNAEGIPTIRGGSQWRVSSVQAAGGYRRPPPLPKESVLPVLPKRRRSMPPT